MSARATQERVSAGGDPTRNRPVHQPASTDADGKAADPGCATTATARAVGEAPGSAAGPVVGVCPHCDGPVVEAVMRLSGQPILLDIETGARGNMRLMELGSLAEFIPGDQRDPKSTFFVPPHRRYRSHMVSCPRNVRSSSPDTDRFITTVDRRLAIGGQITPDSSSFPPPPPGVQAHLQFPTK